VIKMGFDSGPIRKTYLRLCYVIGRCHFIHCCTELPVYHISVFKFY